MEGLNKITYPQKKYHAQTLIERSSPVSNYQYYGRIEERRFYISPVLFGLNRITTVLTGYITESDMGCKATIRVCFAPYIRNTLFVVAFWFVLCFLVAIATVEEVSQIRFLACFAALFLAIFSIILCIFLKKASKCAQEHLPFLENLLCQMPLN
jgi:hypothetical protein